MLYELSLQNLVAGFGGAILTKARGADSMIGGYLDVYLRCRIRPEASADRRGLVRLYKFLRPGFLCIRNLYRLDILPLLRCYPTGRYLL